MLRSTRCSISKVKIHRHKRMVENLRLKTERKQTKSQYLDIMWLFVYFFTYVELLVLDFYIKRYRFLKNNHISMFQLFFQVPICSTQIHVYKQIQISQSQVTLYNWADQNAITFFFFSFLPGVHQLELTIKQLGRKTQGVKLSL